MAIFYNKIERPTSEIWARFLRIKKGNDIGVSTVESFWKQSSGESKWYSYYGLPKCALTAPNSTTRDGHILSYYMIFDNIPKSGSNITGRVGIYLHCINGHGETNPHTHTFKNFRITIKSDVIDGVEKTFSFLNKTQSEEGILFEEEFSFYQAGIEGSTSSPFNGRNIEVIVEGLIDWQDEDDPEDSYYAMIDNNGSWNYSDIIFGQHTYIKTADDYIPLTPEELEEYPPKFIYAVPPTKEIKLVGPTSTSEDVPELWLVIKPDPDVPQGFNYTGYQYYLQWDIEKRNPSITPSPTATKKYVYNIAGGIYNDIGITYGEGDREIYLPSQFGFISSDTPNGVLLSRKLTAAPNTEIVIKNETEYYPGNVSYPVHVNTYVTSGANYSDTDSPEQHEINELYSFKFDQTFVLTEAEITKATWDYEKDNFAVINYQSSNIPGSKLFASITTLDGQVIFPEVSIPNTINPDSSVKSLTFAMQITDEMRTKIWDIAPKEDYLDIRFILRAEEPDNSYTREYDTQVRIYEDNRTKPIVEITEIINTDAKAIELTGSDQIFIKDHSSAKVSFTTQAQAFSSIVSTSCSNSRESYANKNPATINKVSSAIFTVNAVDSRGFIGSTTKNVSIKNYYKPSISFQEVSKDLNEAKAVIEIDGQAYKANFGAKDNDIHVYYRYKNGENQWIGWNEVATVTWDGDKFSCEATLTDLIYTEKISVEVYVKDSLEEVYAPTQYIVFKSLFDWDNTSFNFNIPVNFQAGVVGAFSAGTWTPEAPTGLGLSSTKAYYTRIGNIVTVSLTTAIGTGVSYAVNISIDGLPFTPTGTVRAPYTGLSGGSASENNSYVEVNAGSRTMKFKYGSTASGSNVQFPGGQYSTYYYFGTTIMYETDDP